MSNIDSNKLKLFFDGSCMPKNPGGVARYAWRLLDNDSKEIAFSHGEVCRGPEATNNVAEYASVRNGLRYLKEKNWEGVLEIFGDSQLVIRQLLGEYKVRKDTLIPYHTECMELLKNIEWKAFWIPREQNEECDLLSRKSD
jgi:ribonuclease HI